MVATVSRYVLKVLFYTYVHIAFCWLYAAAAAAAAEVESSSLEGFIWQLSCEDGGANVFKVLMLVEDVGGAGEDWCGLCLSFENTMTVTIIKISIYIIMHRLGI